MAGAANLLIAAAKIAAGLVTGSSAMLSEAAHSVGDTMNQGFLLASLRRSRKPADEEHPFGYGMERYFWSFLAAVGIFVLGAGFSAYEGIRTLLGGGRLGSAPVALAVLLASFLFEGSSLLRAVLQLRREAREASTSFTTYLAHRSDPSVRAVFWEDGVALVGIVLAAAGIVTDTMTGSHVGDGLASLAIAVLLVGVAYGLGRQNMGYLVGRAVSPQLRAGIVEIVRDAVGVDEVLELMTMRLSPEEVLVAARIDLADDLSPEELEHAADEVEDLIRRRFPEVRHVFLDPTPQPRESATPAS